jgi:hypothetical protein
MRNFFPASVNHPLHSPVSTPNQRKEAHTMLNKTIALAFSLAVAFGIAQSASAVEETAAPATVIVYRADESVKTKRINVGIIGESNNVGRLSANKMVTAESPAGQYTLATSVPGSDALTLDLKPGATYYVHAKMAMRGSRVSVELQEVTAQVARVQQPALEAAI